MSYQLNSILSRGKLVFTLNPKTQTRTAKIRIRKPAQPTFDKKLMMAVAEPFERIDTRPSWEKCTLPDFVKKRQQIMNEVHPWAEIKARKLKEELKSSKIVLVMQENCIDEEDRRVARNKVTKGGFTMTNGNRAIARLAFEGTQYDFLLGDGGFIGHGTIPHTVYILGSDSSRLKQILEIVKKMPTYLLLFGIIEGNHVLRRDQLAEVANYPSLDHMRGQLVSTLNQVMASISSNVQNSSYNLTLNLDSYCKQLQKEDSERKK